MGNQPQLSGLSSSTVLDAMDISDSEELSDHDSDSDVQYIEDMRGLITQTKFYWNSCISCYL